jgi:starvation-inducible DNA-binding protein
VATKSTASRDELTRRRQAALATPTDLQPEATREISGALNLLLADVFALYMKTKNFHWHVSGPHFRDYHLLFDEQASQVFAMSDPIAERVRRIGGATLRSTGNIARLQRLQDNDADFVEAADMLAELREDNRALVSRLRELHDLCDKYRDFATASLIEGWIDETEKRTWMLYEAGRRGDRSGH